jgi:ribonucleoside-diphosphate reductase alpha chain
MGVLRIDHPDVEAFLHAKQNSNRLTGFNISLAVTDEFMRCVVEQRPFALRFGGVVYRHVDAVALWDAVMRSTWDWAEPGVLFIDRINEMNNLHYAEVIAATNPCGEQPLPPFGACLLGSFNLAAYVREGRCDDPEGNYTEISRTHRSFDWGKFAEDVPLVVEAMDRVIDVARYPLPEQQAEARCKRRMGLGITALANLGQAFDLEYGSADFVELERRILKRLRRLAYQASARLAVERGSFFLYDRDRYLEGKFIQTLDADVRKEIEEFGIRNSHLLSIAPTGTISLCADNVSSGIEPVFASEVRRRVMRAEGEQEVVIRDFGLQQWGRAAKPSSEVTVKEHLDVLAVAQEYVDSAVSKTLNVPPKTSWEDFKRIYVEAWRRGCKGCTTFQVGGKRQGILTDVTPQAKPAYETSCTVDPATGVRECV